VPRENDRLIGKREELLTDISEQGLRVAAGKIRPPDGSGEERISYDGNVVPHKRDTSWAVPGHVSHFEGQTTQRELVTFCQLVLGWGRRLEVAVAKPFSLARHAVVQLPIGRMQIDRHARGVDDDANAEDVVEVRMREPDRAKIERLRSEAPQEEFRLLAGID
jgi:hypothetical protein